MKKLLLLSFVFFASFGYSQVIVKGDLQATGTISVAGTGASSFNGSVTIGSSTTNLSLSVNGTQVPTGKTQNRYTVGTGGNFATIQSAVTWLSSGGNMASHSELLLGSGVYTITDSIGISLPYNLLIRGAAFDETYVNAATGLTGKPMFNVRSNVNFERITFSGSSLTGYGTGANENFCNITANDLYCELTNFEISTFKKGINLTGGSEIFVFNSIIDSCYRGVEVNSTDTAKIDVEVTNFENCSQAVRLAKTVKGGFDLINIIFKNSSIDTAVYYDGSNYTYNGFPVMIACNWNNKGVFTTGFNFTLDRDANIYFRGNVGLEDKVPHAKVNFSSASPQTFISNTWQKATFTSGNNYTCKFTIATDSITYLPSYTQDLMMWISGAIQTSSSQTNIQIAVVKNHSTATLYGLVPVTLDQNTRSFNFSTNVYIPNAVENDVFSIWIRATGANEDLTITGLNWLVDGQ